MGGDQRDLVLCADHLFRPWSGPEYDCAAGDGDCGVGVLDWYFGMYTSHIGIAPTHFTQVAALYLDIFGRRKMLMLGSSIMTIGNVVVAGIIGKYANQFKENPQAGYAGAAFIYM
jgi:MFS family permease